MLKGVSSQGFDADGKRESLSDAHDNKTQFQFDKNGRLVQKTLATSDKVSYTYNARDLLESVTNGRNQQRQFVYDEVGRLKSWTDIDGTVSYTYDANSNLLTVTDANGTITREYDKLNRVTKYTDIQGNTLQYAYNEVGNLVTLTYPNNKQVRYEYDAADQLIEVTDWANRETQYSYDKNGRLISVLRQNGTKMTRVYNEAGQLLEQKDVVIATGEVISQFDFSYDKAGNIIQELIIPQPQPPQFTLPTSMTYGLSNRLATYNEFTVQFDADGNMIKGPLSFDMANFAFDSRNRLMSAGKTVYHYNAENQRIGVNQTQYVINSQPVLSQVLVRTRGNGEVTYYVYGLGLIGSLSAGNYFSYHYDLRGSTVALTDETGQVTSIFQYSPYGLLMSGDASQTPFLFNGMYGVMTGDNGLYYMRARFYSPEIRRFVNQDILLGGVADGQTLNRYAYVTGQPVSFIDPWGLYAIVLINTYGGEGFGHGAIAIQNRVTEMWEYYSFAPVGGSSLELIFNLSIRGKIEHSSHSEGDFIKFLKKEMYNDFLIIKTSPKEERKMRDYADKIKGLVDADMWWYRYRLYSNSCIDLVTDTIQEGISLGGLPGYVIIETALKPNDLIDAIIKGLSPFRNVTESWRTDNANDIKLDQPPPLEKKAHYR